MQTITYTCDVCGEGVEKVEAVRISLFEEDGIRKIFKNLCLTHLKQLKEMLKIKE